jgi:hypothetical protein
LPPPATDRIGGVVVSKEEVLGCSGRSPLDDKQEGGPKQRDAGCVQNFHVFHLLPCHAAEIQAVGTN